MDQLEDEDKDEDREETVEEKIDRLTNEIQDLREQAERLRSSLPPITRPPVPEPLLKLRHEIKEKDIERELLLEHQRASKVVEEYLQENPSILEKIDECPICLEPIFDVSGSCTFLCCGNKTCGSCTEPLYTANDTCPLCRERFPPVSEHLSILRPKVAEGKAWAQALLGSMHYTGASGLAVDRKKAESLLRMAAEQGHSHAYYQLGFMNLERKNYSDARQLLEAAADHGHMAALGILAERFFLGVGAEKDVVKAVRLLTVSAKLQRTVLRVRTILGECFAKGEGGLKWSPVRSVHYMKPAIESNDPSAASAFSVSLYGWSLLAVSAEYYPDYIIAPSGHSNVPEALFWYRRSEDRPIQDLESFGSKQVLEKYESKIKEMCACCYRPLSTEKPKCCVECKAVYYCSRECQATDWKAGHKKDCVKSLKKRLRATGKFDNI